MTPNGGNAPKGPGVPLVLLCSPLQQLQKGADSEEKDAPTSFEQRPKPPHRLQQVFRPHSPLYREAKKSGALKPVLKTARLRGSNLQPTPSLTWPSNFGCSWTASLSKAPLMATGGGSKKLLVELEVTVVLDPVTVVTVSLSDTESARARANANSVGKRKAGAWFGDRVKGNDLCCSMWEGRLSSVREAFGLHFWLIGIQSYGVVDRGEH